MNKKGFTLIELLSVVIILSIIIFLVLPNVTNLLKSNEDKTNEITLSLIENAAKLHMEDNNTFYKKIDDSKYCIRINKLVKNDYLEGRIKYNNEDITDTKSIQVTYNQGFTYELVDNASCTGDIIGCTVVKGDGTKTGDEIECGGEYFYVIENDGTTISMLAKYNLDVGKYYNAETSSYLDIQNQTGIQNENSKGYISSTEIYGTLAFSSTSYWWDTETSKYKDEYSFENVYDDNSNLYKHIKKYEQYLKENGVSNLQGTLITLEELKKLGCNTDTNSCLSSEYEWIYSTTYWSGSASGSISIWYVDMSGMLKSYGNGGIGKSGLRPVINISINEI